MKIPRWTQRGVALLALLAAAARLPAQGVTTGAVGGTITDQTGAPIAGVQVQVVNKATGYSAGALSRANGAYLVQGLEAGGPYTVSARRIGLEPVSRNDVVVSLSQTTRVDLKLGAAAAVSLAAVEVVATTGDISPTKTGVSTQVSDTVISRLPTLTRNFTDLVKLVPQVSRSCNENTSGGYSCGASAGGQYNRFNNFTIDGANQNDRFNLASSGGLPGAAGGGRVISPDAVREFRVLMSPTDVRQANFTGMLVNAVTKSGTNDFHGSVGYNFRNEKLSATNYRNTVLDFKQYSFTLGGPIIKDKLHFFIAPAFQTRSTAAAGAFVGGTAAQTGTTLNISSDSIALVQQIIRDKMGFDPGTSGKVDIDNPLRNLFGRLDYQLNDVHRLVLRGSFNRTENVSFSRNFNNFQNNPLQQNQGFRLGSNQFNGVNTNNSTVLQAFSNWQSGRSNEFIFGYNTIRDERIVPATTPEMAVGVVPANATGSAATNPTAAITFGTEQFSIGNRLKQDILELQDNVSLPFGAHTVTLGGRYERAKIYNNFPQGLGGVWVFPNITALNNLQPSGYAVAYPNSGNAGDIPASFATNMLSAYVQDQWGLASNLTVTAGVRADVPSLDSKPSENENILNLSKAGGAEFHTSWSPKTRIYWSPRVGINWDIGGTQTNQLRANTGIFTGPPPFILVANAYQNTGLGLVRLSCTGANTPAFTIDQNNLPHACRGQNPPANGAAGTAGINLNDPNFKYPQSYVASAGFDRALPFNIVGTLEGLYRHDINGLRIRNLNLKGPRMVNGQVYTDVNGRVLYADTISATGAVTNTRQRAITAVNGTSFAEDAIYLTNQSKGYNYTLTGQLKKNFSSGLRLTAAYNYNRAYEVQALTSDRAISNWRNGREYSGLESDDQLTTSSFERRHRIVAYGSYTMPWKRNTFPTDLSFYFERQSGVPITYTANLDLNGDGFNGNDPIYVPSNTSDPNQIKLGTMTAAGVFTQDAAATQAFDQFISSQSCLNAQRGKIMQRNSCFSPWQSRFDLSIRQGVPTIRGQRASVQLDIVNAVNAIGKVLEHVDGKGRDWGHYSTMTASSFSQQQVLLGASGTGQINRSPGALSQSMPVYTFNSSVRTRGPYDFINNLGYLMQLTFKYDF
ncbi:MAG TPA: carboxypeptidase regulatory-like domain-containing protein [Gemmatimonadaceae bacterium]